MKKEESVSGCWLYSQGLKWHERREPSAANLDEADEGLARAGRAEMSASRGWHRTMSAVRAESASRDRARARTLIYTWLMAREPGTLGRCKLRGGGDSHQLLLGCDCYSLSSHLYIHWHLEWERALESRPTASIAGVNYPDCKDSVVVYVH